MGLEVVDKSGTARPDSAFEEALVVVGQRMVRLDVSDPELFMQYPVILDALREVLAMRAAIRKHAETKGES